MSRRIRSDRRRTHRFRPRIEQFEPRHLLSFTVVATDPAPGASLTTPPPSLTFTFDQPLDQTSFSLQDVSLERVDDQGGVQIVDGVEAPGPEADQIVFTPSAPISPGHYRMTLDGGSGLLDTNGEGLAGDVVDRTLGDFQVAPQGVHLSDAVDLGTPGTAPTLTGGSLDLQANPGAVAFYKISLPSGHFWRLGLEVSAERDGGTLDSALALFDEVGHPIAVDDLGRRDAPFDPYLFAGVPPGTYFIGVSGAGNLPGSPGGYDPVVGDAGTVPQTQVGGPFTLHVVADPADRPISLQSFAVDRADPLDPTPTGLTLRFSGVVRLGDRPGLLGDFLSRSVEVVDQNGHLWPIAASSAIESKALLAFLFRERLPRGTYTVRLPARDGLADLAGLSPVAPGQPPGVLGTFVVGPETGRVDRNDFGPLFPDAAMHGITFDASLNPGHSVSYRLVVTFPSVFSFQTRYRGGTLAVSLTGPQGSFPVDAGAPGAVNGTNDTFLNPGVYEVELSADGSQPVSARLTLAVPSFSLESLLQNGIGQGPALSLRLIAPRVLGLPSPGGDQAGGGVSRTTETSVTGQIPPPTSQALVTSNAQTVLPTVAPQIPVLSRFLGFGGDFVGRPAGEGGAGWENFALTSNLGAVPQSGASQRGIAPRVGDGDESGESALAGGSIPSEPFATLSWFSPVITVLMGPLDKLPQILADLPGPWDGEPALANPGPPGDRADGRPSGGHGISPPGPVEVASVPGGPGAGRLPGTIWPVAIGITVALAVRSRQRMPRLFGRKPGRLAPRRVKSLPA